MADACGIHEALKALPVVIIGGGPIGLASAVHLLERGLEPLIVERGPSAGDAIKNWHHVSMFSSWEFNVDPAARALLDWHGWDAPSDTDFPNGREFVQRYLLPLASTPSIAERLRYRCEVSSVSRTRVGKVMDLGREVSPLDVRVRTCDGGEERILASAVIDASGTSLNPNYAGCGGTEALGERYPQTQNHIYYGMPDIGGADKTRYAGKRVIVAGSGHSSVGVLLGLADLQEETGVGEISWILRRSFHQNVLGGGSRDQLQQRGALGTRLAKRIEDGMVKVIAPMFIEAIRSDGGQLTIAGASGDGAVQVEADELIVVTGLRPDLSTLSEMRLDLDGTLECPRRLAEMIDPNVHKCGTVRAHGAFELMQPEQGFFIAGMKSYGRAPNFLLPTGYEQVRSIAAWLAGDMDGARRVELVLPETGVCEGREFAAEACCTDAAPAAPARCC